MLWYINYVSQHFNNKNIRRSKEFMKAKYFLARLIAVILLLCICLASCTDVNDVSDDSKTNDVSSGDSHVIDSEGSDDMTSIEEASREVSSNISNDASSDASNETSVDLDGDTKTYKHVIVIGVDGAGAFFNTAETPNIDEIFKNGAVTYDAVTENPSISAQCWGSLLHGVKCTYHGLTNAIVASTPYPTDSQFPSFFKIVRENDADAKLASFTHWNPINIGIIENGIDIHKVGGISDAEITSAVCDYVKKEAPTLVFVQFDDVDAAGHASGYGNKAHLQKITEIDGHIAKIYEAYRSSGIIDDTLFIVTADHGGNGNSHGGTTDSETKIMFAATGKTVQNGIISEMAIRDTASIVLHAFGYTQPDTWTSRVPSGLFEGVTASERPVYVNKDSDRYHESVPTPSEGDDGYITDFVSKAPEVYLTFDGDINDKFGAETIQSGKLYYIDGYFGNAVSLDDGYITLKNKKFGTDSFSVSLWVHTEGVVEDPLLLSNKNWQSGRNKGFALTIRNTNMLRFNYADGVNRVDCNAVLPDDYKDGWVNVILVVDRQNDQISLCCDFGSQSTVNIPDILKNVSLDAFSDINIGQDGTGNYEYSMPASIDELMIFDYALTREDIGKLANYYGKEAEESPIRQHETAETPAKGSGKYISEMITDKKLLAYLDLDGSVNCKGDMTATANGKIEYCDGFFGKAAILDNGYISINDYAPGTDSFTIATWVKTSSVKGDPALFSNKNWQSGKNNGFILSLRDTNDLKFNMGQGGTQRTDKEILLPADYTTGWMHVIMSVDRKNGKVMISIDFGEFVVIELPSELKNASLDAYDVLNIGQDGTGKYGSALTAAIDEFMIFGGAFDTDDVNDLKSYFGV